MRAGKDRDDCTHAQVDAILIVGQRMQERVQDVRAQTGVCDKSRCEINRPCKAKELKGAKAEASHLTASAPRSRRGASVPSAHQSVQSDPSVLPGSAHTRRGRVHNENRLEMSRG